MRRRYVYDPATKEMVEVAARHSEALHFIQDDLPGYESPIDGRWVEGRAARREDLRRNHCRPYEGREQEEKQAARVRAGHDQKLDELADKMAHRMWAEAPERLRKQFRYK